MIAHDASRVTLYNSPLETGLRALALLNAFYPRQVELTELTWFDHLVVHTADLGGPPSLHPDVFPRTGELLVRRRLVEESLQLMRQVELVEMLADQDGIRYLCGDDAPAFLEMLQSPYSVALRERAHWLSEHFGAMSHGEIEAVVKERVGRWTAEFQSLGQQNESTQ